MKRYIANIPGINPDLLRPVKKPERLPSWLPAGRTYLTPTGRSALYYGARAMGLKKGDEILIPSFVCTTVSVPLAKAGAKLLFFNIKRDMTIDWDHVKSLMNPRVKAFAWYHYLGLSFGFDQVIPFCRKNGLYLIEDCAHALFSLYKGKPVGSTGDYAVYSIRKSIPALFSAALIVNNPCFKVRNFTPNVPMSPRQSAYAAERENYLHQLYLQTLDSTKQVDKPLYAYHAKKLDQVYNKGEVRAHQIDPLSLHVMHNVNPAEVRNKRHRNYLICLKHLKQHCPYKTLPAGNAPIGFPIFHPRREAFRKRMLEQGVEFLVHWHAGLLPKGVAERFPDAAWLGDHIISLPCHHDLSVADMEYMCKMVKKSW